MLVPPVEFRAIVDPETAPDVLRWNGDVAVSSRDKLIRWQEWYRKAKGP